MVLLALAATFLMAGCRLAGAPADPTPPPSVDSSAFSTLDAAGLDLIRQTKYSVTSGTSTGLEVNYDLRYDGTKDVQVIIVHVWPMD